MDNINIEVKQICSFLYNIIIIKELMSIASINHAYRCRHIDTMIIKLIAGAIYTYVSRSNIYRLENGRETMIMMLIFKHMV